MIDPLCKEIIRRLRITRFVETGTDMGETVAAVSRWFAELYPQFGQISHAVVTGAKTYNPWNEPIRYPAFENATDCPIKVHSVDLAEYSYQNTRQLIRFSQRGLRRPEPQIFPVSDKN